MSESIFEDVRYKNSPELESAMKKLVFMKPKSDLLGDIKKLTKEEYAAVWALVKDRCVCCGRIVIRDIHRYALRGNYCNGCPPHKTITFKLGVH